MFINKHSRARGAQAGADAVRGATALWHRGPLRHRSRFPTDKASLSDRDEPLSLHQRLRIERWLLQ